MAVSLNSILDFIIPVVVVIFVIFICLYPFRVPLGKLWNKIKDWRSNREESYEDNSVKVIRYE